MSDQSKYINTYIENSMNMIHEQISLVLQLKTQAKLASDMVAEKTAALSSLEEDLQSVRSQLGSNNDQINESRALASRWEQEYNSMKAKVEHVDTFANQINEMKIMLLDKNKEIETLQKKIDALTKPKTLKPSAPKKVINTEDKREEPIVMKVIEPEDKNDDF